MLERLQARLEELGITSPAEDASLLKTLLGGGVRWILAETGQTEVPEDLVPAVVDMAAGEYLFFLESAGRLEGFDQEHAVRQMSQGDTSVTYAVEFGRVSPVAALIERLTSPPEALVNQWRRLRW